ncbi:unnamed protein product [Phaedon cochleariae]|uniref:Uncharacterized protein n=1 Tax=Phaedon cochleariae TaxID=80249 RepID=A0A9P0DZ87_PHACE|nr:unnamed protein product [Phaedon cochleariae]
MDPNNTNPGEENGIQIEGLENQQSIPQQSQTDFTEDNTLAGSETTSQDFQLSGDSYSTEQNNVPMYIAPIPPNTSNLALEPEGNEHLDNIPGEPYYHIEENKQEGELTKSHVDEKLVDSNVVSEENNQNNGGHVTVGMEQQYVQSTDDTLNEDYVQREDENFESQYESENKESANNSHSEISEQDVSSIKVEDNLAVDVIEEDNTTEVMTAQPEKSVAKPTDESLTSEEAAIENQGEERSVSQIKQELSAMEVEKSKNVDIQDAEPTKHNEKPTESVEMVELQSEVQIHQDSTVSDTVKTKEKTSEMSVNPLVEVASEEIEAVHVIEDEPDMPELEQEPIDRPARRGRRSHEVPMHLLGHDMARPVDSVPNGRSMPKPRLGVKVPYRNLASQIVSKEELEKEILERSRAKVESINAMGDPKFARGLTQRLASKIAPAPDRGGKQKKGSETTTESIDVSEPSQQTEKNDQSDQEKNPDSDRTVAEEIIENDDDLLAILEGEGEEMPVLPKEVPDCEIMEIDDVGNLKMLEREIALQQLQELPHLEPKPRIFKSRQAKTSVQPPQPSPRSRIEKPSTADPKTPSAAPRTSGAVSKIPTAASRSSPKPVQKPVSAPKTPDKQVSKPKLYHSPSPVKAPIEIIDMPPAPKKVYEVEPQVKVNMVLKTYSRKRKPSDSADFESAYPKRMSMEESDLIFEKPDPLALPTDVYVTKSSRVIKKKVIWDPDDEFSARKSFGKTSESRTSTPKAVKATEKSANSEKILDRKAIEKSASGERSANEKKAVEKTVEKRAAVQEKKIDVKPAEKKITPKKTPDKPKTVVQKVSPAKAAKTPIKSKRGLSEVDRLLMDEGAVKMLYELNNSDDSPQMAKRQKDYISLDKYEKDLIKKANRLKSDLVLHNTSGGESSAKSLRKKEGGGGGGGGGGSSYGSPPGSKPAVSMERKMSKDSTRSSVHTPPRSPTFPGSMMLIRRRSSSSMSSSEDADAYLPPKTTSKRKSDGQQRGKKAKKVTDDGRGEAATESVSAERGRYKSFTVKKSGKHVAIDLHYIDERCFLDTKVLDELTTVLKKYGSDKECTVVSLVSSSTAFCLGLDYATLVSDDDITKTCRATDLATKVRDFLLCLLKFPKVLVAGIQGECVGLGVTMLPLFDMVIASDTATFGTPYASLGCQGEGVILLNYPNLTNNGLTAELLYAGTTLTADEAVRRGLISKLCWPEKYKDTLKSILSSISQGSNQSLEATKKQLRGHLFNDAEAAIKAETNALIEQWLSPECQASFSKL